MRRPLRVVNATQEERPLIAFDLNGVLADANTMLLDIIKAKYKITMALTEIRQYDSVYRRLLDSTGDRDVGRWLKATVNDPDFILSLVPYEGMFELMAQIKDYDVRVVTGHAYNPDTVGATTRWLQNHGFTGQCDFTRWKDGWCRQTRAKYLVEDSPLHAIACSEAGTPVLLVDKPYNRVTEGSDILRVYGPEDILTHIGGNS